VATHRPHPVPRLLHAERRHQGPDLSQSQAKRPELAQAESSSFVREASSSAIATTRWDLRSQYVIVQQTSELLKIHREGLSPQARSEFQAGIAAYQSNKQDFQALLTAFLDVLHLDEDYWQNMVEYETAVAPHRAAHWTVIALTGERNDENVSHWIFGGIDWKRRAWRRPRWVVLHYRALKPMADSETKMANSTAKDSMADSMPHPLQSTEAPLVPVQISPPALAAYRGQDRQGRTEISRRRDSHHRQCRCGRKATGLRPSAVLRHIQKVVCRCHLPIRPERAAAIHSLQPGASGDRTGIFSGQAESAASGAEYGARCRPQRSIAARRGCGASQAVGRSAKRNHSPRIHRPSASRNWKSIRRSLGYITERNALPSVAVQPEMRLYTIADLSTVWVQAQVFQNDLERIKIGAPAALTVNTYPGRDVYRPC